MSAVKALQQWCKAKCDGYRDVSITNMTTSFRDGLAFCALIHKHRPELINFDSLKKDNVYENNKLAFKVAEEELGIPALLDAEDMVALKIPDRLSILTYVSQYYNYFHGRSPIGGMAGVKRPAEDSENEPSGKKNQPVVSKLFPSSKPATENYPPSSSSILSRAPSPVRPSPAARKEFDNNSSQTGTLSNKCVSCHTHVHLVQRHLVDGKLYHRHCAKSLSTLNTNTPLRDLQQNTSPFKHTPRSDTVKPNNSTAAPFKASPSWLTTRTQPANPPGLVSSTTASPHRSAAALRSSGSEASGNASAGLSVALPLSSGDTRAATSASPRLSRTGAAGSLGPSDRSRVVTTAPTNATRPTPAARTSAAALKTQQAKLKFLQKEADDIATKEDGKTTAKDGGCKRWFTITPTGQGAETRVGQDVCLAVVGAKGVSVSGNAGGDGSKGGALSDGPAFKGYSDSSKTQEAAALISRKLAKESNGNDSSKPTIRIELRKADKLSDVELPKRGISEAIIRGRVKLNVNPSLLADLRTPSVETTPGITSPANMTGHGDKTPDKGYLKPASAPAGPENSEGPAEWRSKLKPVTKDTKNPKKPLRLPPNAMEVDGLSKHGPTEAGKSQASKHAVGPSTNRLPSPPSPKPGTISFMNGSKALTANGAKPEPQTSKNKQDHIPKEKILKELQEIEDNLNELEKQGVVLEKRLRRNEEEEEDDAVMNELMVDWFNLIREKQLAMRRESELVYIAKTQDLEEQQPTVEQELRRLMDKPDQAKTYWEKKREKELMAKLVEIVNDRNAIVEGLDEDRLREDEEDEQLQQLMLNLDINKDKPKKKSPMSRLFKWGHRKDE